MKHHQVLTVAAGALVLLLGWSHLACAQWTNNPYTGMAVVTNQTGEDINPQIVRLSSGNSLIIWQRSQEYRAKYQVLNSNGDPMLGETGQYLIEGPWSNSCYCLVPDGDGGAIAVILDSRSGHEEIYGQRYDTQGNRMWGSNGEALATWPQVVEIGLKDVAYDEEGYFFISWVTDTSPNNLDMNIQKFDREGNLYWGSSGITVSSSPGNQNYGQIVPDSRGGALIIWEDNRNNPYDYYLYGQHLNAAGDTLWANNGVSLNYQSQPLWAGGLQEGVMDGFGGGVWAMSTPGSDNTLKVFRLVDRHGSPYLAWMWTTTYSCTHWYGGLLRHPSDGNFWLSTEENRFGGPSLGYLYRFDISGTPLWGPEGLPYVEGIPFGTDYKNAWTVVSDGVITFRFVDYYQYKLVALRINNSGHLVWSSFVAYAEINQQATTSDGHDGTIITFQKVVNESWDISAQKVNADGSLGSPNTPIQPLVSSQSQPLNILYQDNSLTYIISQPALVNIILYDLLGRQVAHLEQSYKTAGTYVTPVNTKNLPTGVYLLKTSTPTQQQIIKIVLTK
jgi:hypothetical protein